MTASQWTGVAIIVILYGLGIAWWIHAHLDAEKRHRERLERNAREGEKKK